MEEVFAKLGVFLSWNLKMDEKFCQDNICFGVIKPVGKLVEDIRKLMQKNFIEYVNYFDEAFLILFGKYFYRLYQVCAFYQKAHSPSLFMTAHSRNQEFKFCSELGRKFDSVDRLHFVDNGKLAANFFKSPFDPPVDYELYTHGIGHEIKKSSRLSNTFVYRAVETISETKYNNKKTAKTKKRVYKELMPNFIAYLICCARDIAFQQVSFEKFCKDTSVFRYLVSNYNVDTDHKQTSEQWIGGLMVEVLKQLDIRYLKDISDGCVLVSHSGRKRDRLEITVSDTELDESSVDSESKKKGEKEGNLSSLLMLAEMATRKHFKCYDSKNEDY